MRTHNVRFDRRCRHSACYCAVTHLIARWRARALFSLFTFFSVAITRIGLHRCRCCPFVSLLLLFFCVQSFFVCRLCISFVVPIVRRIAEIKWDKFTLLILLSIRLFFHVRYCEHFRILLEAQISKLFCFHLWRYSAIFAKDEECIWIESNSCSVKRIAIFKCTRVSSAMKSNEMSSQNLWLDLIIVSFFFETFSIVKTPSLEFGAYYFVWSSLSILIISFLWFLL